MFRKIKDIFLSIFEFTRITILRTVLAILYRKQIRPFVFKYLELKSGTITQEEFDAWCLASAMGL